MSRTKALKNVKLTSFDDLFGGKVVEETAETGDVKEIPLSELHEFHNHPFQVRSDEELEEMIESVREHGVLVPGIVRKREQGGYEIIAGHTRKHVCEMLPPLTHRQPCTTQLKIRLPMTTIPDWITTSSLPEPITDGNI